MPDIILESYGHLFIYFILPLFLINFLHREHVKFFKSLLLILNYHLSFNQEKNDNGSVL